MKITIMRLQHLLQSSGEGSHKCVIPRFMPVDKDWRLVGLSGKVSGLLYNIRLLFYINVKYVLDQNLNIYISECPGNIQ